MMRLPRALVFAVFAILHAAAGWGQVADPAYRLDLAAPIATWDEAVPLGNGITGGLLWGEGNLLRLSLDRGDLWDLRTPAIYLEPDWTYKTIQRLVKEGNQGELVRRFDAPFEEIPYPTKLPGARLEMTLDKGRTLSRFSLDMRRAVGTARFGDGEASVFFSAAQPIALMRVKGTGLSMRIVPPASLAKLGYEPAQTGSTATEAWLFQRAAGQSYAVVAESRRAGPYTDVAVAVVSSQESTGDPLALARFRTRRALSAGYDRMLGEHQRWWKDFWDASSVTLPDARLQRHYNLVQYFYGAASRPGAPPMPLQGVWTADAGSLPPWKGDFHFDLNVQLTYWAYLQSGRFDSGLSYLDFMWSLIPAHKRFARDFFEAEGIVVPGVMALDGQPLAGWAQYSLSPVQGAWVVHGFYQHWKYTGDREFLRARAYPYAVLVAEGLLSLMAPDERGKLKLPLSSSPEIHDNSLRAWMTPLTNYDLSLIRWLFGALAEMATGVDGKQEDKARWEAVTGKLDALAVDEKTKVLKVSPTESLQESHRHLSHLMAIHPLGTLNVEGSADDRAAVIASLDNLRALGTKNWVGYSFAWAACAEARAGRGDAAFSYLDAFVRAFILRNGFHANGDQTKSGLSNFTYRPFTLEGNFAAAQAVHEMLMQSWGGLVRLFPAVPDSWRDISFDRQRAEGGFAVSARRVGGKVTSVRVESSQTGTLRLQDPFDAGAVVSWSIETRGAGGAPRRAAVTPTRGPGRVVEVRLQAGQTLVAALAEGTGVAKN